MMLSSFSVLADVAITNGFATNQQGYWSVNVSEGGESTNAYITATGTPSGTVFTNIEIIWEYVSYIDTGSGVTTLSATSITTPAYLSSPGEVTSAGEFLGSGDNTIGRTMVSTIAAGSSTMSNELTLTAQQGTLGVLDFYQYLDEDVIDAFDDFFFTLGSAATGNLQLFTIDSTEAIGVSHSGGLNTSQGLSNSLFAGWAACNWNVMNGAIVDGTQSVATTGVICGNLTPSNHAIAGAGYGPNDIVSSLKWSVDPDASTATIVTSLGGVPDIRRVTRAPTPALPVPTLGGGMLALLVLLLGGVTFLFVRRQKALS